MGRRGPEVFGALLAVVAVIALVVAFTRDEPAAPVVTTTTTTSTTSTSTTTTTPVATFDPTITEIAVARVPTVTVWRELPPEAAATLNPAVTAATEAGFSQLPAYSHLRPSSDPIPALDAPVVGRRATETGWEFDHPTPWNYELTFVVTENHGEWLKVMLPVRPNGSQGWVHSSQVRTSTINAHVRIGLSERRLVAVYDGHLIADTPVVIGAPSSPTPTGRFFITDYDEKYEGSAYGPWIAPLSGFSEALDSFSGGAPVIAIHGTNNPGLVGQARSNGCIRVPNDVITAIRNVLPLGTPVDIWP